MDAKDQKQFFIRNRKKYNNCFKGLKVKNALTVFWIPNWIKKSEISKILNSKNRKKIIVFDAKVRRYNFRDLRNLDFKQFSISRKCIQPCTSFAKFSVLLKPNFKTKNNQRIFLISNLISLHCKKRPLKIRHLDEFTNVLSK